MTEFLAALLVFLASHMVPTRPALRRRMTALLGERGYTAAYSVLSIGLLAWLISAAWRAPYVPVWDPAPWQAALALGLVPVGLFLFFAGAVTRNPLSASFRPGMPARAGAILAITRHPILWGLALWALAHTIANGDLVGILLFGTLALFAALGTLALDRRKRRVLGKERWRELAAETGNLPFAAALKGTARLRLDAAVAVGLLAAVAVSAGLLVLPGHLWLFGMDPVIWWVAR